ncbi:MAG: hypothetical protein M1834_008922 [Cirrosporium novae-zelandiae]|nr:MAG: hypothetical protein M1834_008922 [Cirrosporium novae-zelandiae]
MHNYLQPFKIIDQDGKWIGSTLLEKRVRALLGDQPQEFIMLSQSQSWDMYLDPMKSTPGRRIIDIYSSKLEDKLSGDLFPIFNVMMVSRKDDKAVERIAVGKVLVEAWKVADWAMKRITLS